MVNLIKNGSSVQYMLQANDRIDNLTLGMMVNNEIEGIAALKPIQSGNDRYYKYELEGRLTLTEYLGEEVKKEKLLQSFYGIASAIKESEEYMINMASFVLDMDNVYVDPESGKTYLICVPLLGTDNDGNTCNFFKNILFTAQFDPEENGDYVGRLITFLNPKTYTLDKFIVELEDMLNFEHRAFGVYEEEDDTAFEAELEKQEAALVKREEDWKKHLAEEAANEAANEAATEEVTVKEAEAAPAVSEEADSPASEAAGETIAEAATEAATQVVSEAGSTVQATAEAADMAKTTVEEVGAKTAGITETVKETADVTVNETVNEAVNETVEEAVEEAATVVADGAAEKADSVQEAVTEAVSGATAMETGKTAVAPAMNEADAVTPAAAKAPASEEQNMAFLIRVATNERIAITKDRFVVGSDRSNVDYYVVGNPDVEDIHAFILKKGEEYFILDNQTRTGTFINNVPLIYEEEPAFLPHGAHLRLASEEFEFKMHE